MSRSTEAYHDVLIRIGAEIAAVKAGIGLDRGGQAHLLRIGLDVGDGLFDVHTVDRAHERRRLERTSLLLSLFIAGPGEIAEIAVTGRIEEDLRRDLHSAALAEERDGPDAAVFHVRIDHLRVEQQLDARFPAGLEGDDLEDFVVIDRHRVVHGAPVVFAAGAARAQGLDQLLRDAADHRVSILIQKAEQRQTERQVSAQVTVLLHEQHPRALPRGGDRRGQPAGAAAEDDNIIIQQFQFHGISFPLCGYAI